LTIIVFYNRTISGYILPL